MSAFVVVDLTVRDVEKLTQYSAASTQTLVNFGGEFIAKGGIEALYGKSDYVTKVIIQFPNKEKARNWYESDQYQALIPLRTEGMDCQFHLIG